MVAEALFPSGRTPVALITQVSPLRVLLVDDNHDSADSLAIARRENPTCRFLSME